MLTEICAEIKNYFTYDEDKIFSTFQINGGHFIPPIDFKTEYYRIAGSRKNDGVYKVGDPNVTLKDEVFTGSVWMMSVPQDFLNLCEKIKKWNDVNGQADSTALSPFNSESFGGYSYSKSGGYASDKGNGWQSTFASELNRYRKIRL